MANDEQPWAWPEKTWREIVQKVRAGRSLLPESWPGGARVAVALSFDSDHETSTLRAAERSPGKLSQGQYGNRQGVPRIRRLLGKHGVPATFFVPAVVALLYPDEQRELADAGHEIGIHGWIHERNSALAPDTERELQMRSADVLERVTGRRPVGIRTPSWDFSQHTLAISREMGLLYDSSLMADDDPYEILENGEPTGMVELPVEWIRDDAVYFNMDRFSALRPHTPPSAVLEIFKAEFDGAYEERGLYVLTMHPHIIGPGPPTSSRNFNYLGARRRLFHVARDQYHVARFCRHLQPAAAAHCDMLATWTRPESRAICGSCRPAAS